MKQEAVKLTDVWVSFDGHPVLQEQNITLYQDDFIGIIGPNGGGKTTLLKVILGLVQPSRGQVQVFGQDPVVARKRIGYVPQLSFFDRDFPIDVMDVVLMGRLSCRSPFHRFTREDKKAAVLASIACGVIGSLVVTKKITFISGGIAHASFGGIGLGYYLGINPLYCLVPFSLLAALGIGWMNQKLKLAEDTTIGIFWAMGMAVGVIFIGLTPGYAPDLFSYLFGNILTVPRGDVVFMVLLDVFIVMTVGLLYKEFLAVSFDEEFAQVVGVKVNAVYLTLLCLVALTVVLLVRIVGIVLVIALLTIPAAIAKMYTNSLKRMMLYATLIGMGLSIAGLWLSYFLDVASGATIIILSGVVFMLSSLVRFWKRV